mgnify:FL=1
MSADNRVVCWLKASSSYGARHWGGNHHHHDCYFEMGKEKNIKKLQRQLEGLEEKKAQTRNYLLWGALVLICIAIVVSGDTTPGGYW